jgi:hypothetical protein
MKVAENLNLSVKEILYIPITKLQQILNLHVEHIYFYRYPKLNVTANVILINL